MDGEAWWATVPGVAKSQTRPSDFTLFHFTVSGTRDVCRVVLCRCSGSQTVKKPGKLMVVRGVRELGDVIP